MSNLIPDTIYEECGSETLGPTATVTFNATQPNTNYTIFLSGDANERFYWSNKQLTGFTINSSNPSSTATVDWRIISA